MNHSSWFTFGTPRIETLYAALLFPCWLHGVTVARMRSDPGVPDPMSPCCAYIIAPAMGATCAAVLVGPATAPATGIATNLCAALSLGIYAGQERRAIRRKYGIPAHFLPDEIIHAFCSPCATYQEAHFVQGLPVSVSAERLLADPVMYKAPTAPLVQKL